MIVGVLVASSVTVTRPPEIVPSRLSVVFFTGGAPPDPTTGAHARAGPVEQLQARFDAASHGGRIVVADVDASPIGSAPITCTSKSPPAAKIVPPTGCDE